MSAIVFQNQSELLQVIQKLRQYQLKPEPPSLSERQGWIKNLKTGIGVQSGDGSAHNLPRGLISIFVPRVLSVQLALARLAPALLAGNAALVKFSSQTSEALEETKAILDQAKIPEGVVALTAVPRADLSPLLHAHPAIRGVSFCGQLSSAKALFTEIDPARCAFQAYCGGIAYLIVLEEESISPALESLKRSWQQWPLPYAPTQIFVLEKFYDRTKKELIEKMPRWTGGKGAGVLREPLSEKMAQLEAEGARVLVPPAQVPLLIENLPHCSEYQQQEPKLPIVQLIGVKYIHEVGKWVNTSSFGFLGQIWGEKEKALRLADKLELGNVLINKDLPSEGPLLFGVKDSGWGANDLSPDGNFFSQRRSIVN